MTQIENSFYKKKLAAKGEDYVENAPQRISHSVIIDAPVSKVWNILDDTPRFTEWFPGFKSGRMVVASEKGINAKRLGHLNSFKYYEEIIAYREHEAWGFTMLESNSGAMKSIVEVIYLEPLGADTTKVTYKGGYEYNWFFNLMQGVMSGQITKLWTQALNELKEYVE